MPIKLINISKETNETISEIMVDERIKKGKKVSQEETIEMLINLGSKFYKRIKR